jgi:hypothetical protein
MTKLRFNLLRASALVVCAAAVGCSQPVEDTLPLAEAPAVTPAVASPAPAPPLNALTEATAKAQAEVAALGEAASTANEPEFVAAPPAAYQPPFPDRIDLFVPPKRQGGMVISEGGSEDAVELLGFVRLDQRKVVLSINGHVTPIVEGGTQHGIEVISIQPPKVVLQRGRQRWQASLEN